MPARTWFALLLLTSCAEVKTERLLPWFEIRTTYRPAIGGLSGATTEQESFVKHLGFWRKLENCLGGEVLNPDVVAVSCSGAFRRGTALVRKGELVPRPACGTDVEADLILPSKDSIDCFDVLAGRATIVPTDVTMHRVDLNGRTLLRAAFTVDQPGRVFLGPIPRFYGDDGTPYFVTWAEGDRGAPNCALLAVKEADLKLIAAAPELTISECYLARIWSQRTGIALRDSLGRPEAPVSTLPTSPQKLHIVIR